METTPIKRNKNIVFFSREHHDALLFCWKLRWGMHLKVCPERIRKYVKWFWENHLLPHQAEEEKLLFFNEEDGLVRKAIDDHFFIKRKIGIITDKETTPLNEMFYNLADFLEEHTRYEERVLFPYLEKKLTSNDLDHIGNIIEHDIENTVKEEYTDEFWKEPNRH